MKSAFKIVLSVLLMGSYASAYADDYVCRVTYNPHSGSTGNYGYVTIFKYDQPDCQGAFVGSNIFCTIGASYGPCGVANYHYSERGIFALHRALIDAARDEMRVVVSGVACINGGYGCGAYVNFYAD